MHWLLFFVTLPCKKHGWYGLYKWKGTNSIILAGFPYFPIYQNCMNWWFAETLTMIKYQYSIKINARKTYSHVTSEYLYPHININDLFHMEPICDGCVLYKPWYFGPSENQIIFCYCVHLWFDWYISNI